MRGPSCLYSSRRALYRVFVSPADFREVAVATRQLTSRLHNGPKTPSPQPCHSQIRAFTQLPPRPLRSARPPPRSRQSQDNEGAQFDEDLGYDKRYTTRAAVEKSGRARLPRDHEIKDPKITVVHNDVTEGPLLTRHVLEQLSPSESLRMVHPFTPPLNRGDGSGTTPAQLAVCRVVDKKEELAREQKASLQKKMAAAAKRASTPKELELGWAIGAHDLDTKTRQMGQFLEKGLSVEVVFGNKRRKKGSARKAKPEQDVAAELVAKVREEIEARGGKEAKAATGEVGAVLRLFVEKK